MKRVISSVLAAVLCVFLLAAAAPAAQGSDVYFMAVNEKLLELERSTMPMVMGGTLYVPCTMFSIDTTGVNLNVYAMYSAAKNQVLVYSTSSQLIFDIDSGETYMPGGGSYSERAVVRNSTAYVPLARVCDVFRGEISYTVNETAYGRLVRVTSRSRVLTDEQFINAADSLLRSSLNRYLAENPVTTAGPTAPTPSRGSGAAVYLGFTMSGETAAAHTLDALEAQQATAIFFLTAEQLAQKDDLTRELIGRGHFVGLRLAETGDRPVEELLEELRRGQENLSAAAHCKALVILAEGAENETVSALAAAGYVCWDTTADGRGRTGTAYSRASRLMGEMDAGEKARNYLLLDTADGESAEDLLSYIHAEEYQFHAPVAPEL